MYKYAEFHLKGGMKITGVAKDTEVEYNPWMKSHPIAVKVTPLESVWTGSLHFITQTYIRFSLWDLESIRLVEDYLSDESRIKIFLTAKKNPKNFYAYWRRIAKKIEILSEEK